MTRETFQLVQSLGFQIIKAKFSPYDKPWKPFSDHGKTLQEYPPVLTPYRTRIYRSQLRRWAKRLFRSKQRQRQGQGNLDLQARQTGEKLVGCSLIERAAQFKVRYPQALTLENLGHDFVEGTTLLRRPVMARQKLA